MSLRDYFAGQALPSAYASVDADPKLTGNPREELFQIAARNCYGIADAMLAARQEPTS